jgi:hypothetical protein
MKASLIDFVTTTTVNMHADFPTILTRSDGSASQVILDVAMTVLTDSAISTTFNRP